MQLAEHDAGVRSACMLLKELSADERTRLEAEMREKAWRDEMDRYDTALAEGIEKGREQERGENVRNMHEDGLSPEQIAKHLRLDLGAVDEILKSHKAVT